MGRVEEIVKKYGIVDIKEFRNYLNRYNDLTEIGRASCRERVSSPV